MKKFKQSVVEKDRITYEDLIAYGLIKLWAGDKATRRDILMSGSFGHMWTANIHVTKRIIK